MRKELLVLSYALCSLLRSFSVYSTLLNVSSNYPSLICSTNEQIAAVREIMQPLNELEKPHN